MQTIHILSTIFILAALLGTGACGQAANKATPTPAPTLQPGDSTRSLTVGSLERTYILHIPPGMDSQQPLPVVFAFHSGTIDALSMQQQSGLNDTADQNGFILVYPNGTGTGHIRYWNASGCCGEASNQNIDDLAFVRQMLADLGTILRIDPKRIYATGLFNGAIFSYRLACEMSDTFAAIAAVERDMLTDPCQPQEPVSVVHVQGLNDRVYNIGDLIYYGGIQPGAETGTNHDIVFPPVEQVIATWVELDGCSGEAKVDKQGTVTHTAYDNCKNGSAVELYAIEGALSAWPNPYAFPTASNQMIWDFFNTHPKP
jgi:polyhydroxybutyrate depolymerase